MSKRNYTRTGKYETVILTMRQSVTKRKRIPTAAAQPRNHHAFTETKALAGANAYIGTGGWWINA